MWLPGIWCQRIGNSWIQPCRTYKVTRKQHEFFSFVPCTELLCDSVRSEHWSVLCPLPCGPSRSAASRESHMCQLSLNSHVEFLTASIMNVAASLEPVCKLSDGFIKNSHIIESEIHSNSFSKQGFSKKASCTDFTSHVSCTLFHLLECTVEHFAYLAAQGVWMTQLPEEQVLFHCVSGLEWNQAGARLFPKLVAPSSMFILNSGIQDSVVKNAGPKRLYASKFRQAAYHRHSGLLDIGP